MTGRMMYASVFAKHLVTQSANTKSSYGYLPPSIYDTIHDIVYHPILIQHSSGQGARGRIHSIATDHEFPVPIDHPPLTSPISMSSRHLDDPHDDR